MLLLSTFGLLLTWFFIFKFDACMIRKTSILVICRHKRDKSIVFAVSIKFCDESGLAILRYSEYDLWQFCLVKPAVKTHKSVVQDLF